MSCGGSKGLADIRFMGLDPSDLEAPAGATTVDPVEALTEAMSENLSKWLRGD